MSLTVVFNAVKTGLLSVLEGLGEAQPSHELGADHLTDGDAPPRIVWVVHGGPCTGPKQGGADGVFNPKEIARRNERIEIYVWGQDFEATERMMNHLVAAMRMELTAHSFRPKSTNWTVGQATATKAGVLCILEIEIALPFTVEPVGVATPTHQTITKTIAVSG